MLATVSQCISNHLLSDSIYIQPLKPGPEEVINHGYMVPTKEGGILIAKNLEMQTEEKQVNRHTCRQVCRH